MITLTSGACMAACTRRMRRHSKNSITIATTPIAAAMPATIGIETLFDFLVVSATEDADDPMVVGVVVVAEVSVVVMDTGGTSPGSRTVYLTSQNIIKFIRQKNSRT